MGTMEPILAKQIHVYVITEHSLPLKINKQNWEITNRGKLFCCGKSHSVVGHIKFSVVASNEDITHDPQGTMGRGNVNAEKSTYTDSDAIGVNS